MNRDERKRRFNEGIVNLLYPPPQPQLEQDPEPVEALIQRSGSDFISGTLYDYENENASTSGDEQEQQQQHDSETVNLTRAQRKRIRKKRLKEEAMRRGKLVGPLLPPSSSTASMYSDQVAVSKDPPSVRSNAAEEGDGGDEPACAKSKKVKHRRMAKGLAKEKRVSASELDSCNQGSVSSSIVDMKETRT